MEVKFKNGTVKEFTNLSNADLHFADLRNADLSGAKLPFTINEQTIWK
jgi:uncharacterized protein YjbI with pentapeptide repeats